MSNGYGFGRYSGSRRSRGRKISLLRPLDILARKIHKNLAKVIKLIAYAVGIGTVLIGIIIAVFLTKHIDSFAAIAYAIVLGSAILALIEFFIIYGIGHIIEQNNEILERLE